MEPEIAKKVKQFFSRYPPKEYKKGEIIIAKDQYLEGIFFLEKGMVRQYDLSRNGQEMTLNIYKPGSFFPMMESLSNKPNQYYFEAINITSIKLAPKERVLKFIKNEPEVMHDLLTRLYSGIEGVLFKMAQLMSGNAYTRLISILIISATRFGKEAADGIRILSTEKDLATQAGISRETVSRQLHKLKKEGLIDIKRSTIIIPDLNKLEQKL